MLRRDQELIEGDLGGSSSRGVGLRGQSMTLQPTKEPTTKQKEDPRFQELRKRFGKVEPEGESGPKVVTPTFWI
jgi:hypothetical protein